MPSTWRAGHGEGEIAAIRRDVSRLSDAELIQQTADLAKQLGVEINLNYSFVQLPPKEAEGSDETSQTVTAENNEPAQTAPPEKPELPAPEPASHKTRRSNAGRKTS